MDGICQKCVKYSKCRIRIHEEVKDVVSRILHTAKISLACEFCPFKEKDGPSYQRLDLVLANSKSIYPTTSRGKGLIDVTIGNPVRKVDVMDWNGECRSHEYCYQGRSYWGNY